MSPMGSWKIRVKKILKQAAQTQNNTTIASSLRQAAKQAHLNREKELSLQLVELSLNFSEQSNQYMLGLVDWHFYQTGERLNPQEINVQGPELKTDLPVKELEALISSL